MWNFRLSSDGINIPFRKIICRIAERKI